MVAGHTSVTGHGDERAGQHGGEGVSPVERRRSHANSGGRSRLGDVGDPDPGRPRMLGDKEDVADAAAVLSVLAAVRSTLSRGRGRSGPVRVLRNAIWYMWEVPRLPPPLERVHYPWAYPWSRAARNVWSTNNRKRPDGGWGFVLEHLYPQALLARDLLDDPTVSDAKAVIEVVSSRILSAVITKNEDRMLASRAHAPQAWESYEDDPWIRYRTAGLELFDFVPLPRRSDS